MESSVVIPQGRVGIPAKIRERLGIKPGTRLVFDLKEGSFEVRPITKATIDSLKGMLKQEPGTQPVTQMLLEAHAEENGGWASSPTTP
jgi:AbrB family looped-hinge helix DNA binding protein